MNEALKKSEEFHLEKTMMDDKMKATDWEATNEEIMELVARESYLQWLKDNEKRNCPRHSTLNLQQMPTNATCSTWDQPSVSHTTNTLSSSDIRMSPPRHQRYNLPRTNSKLLHDLIYIKTLNISISDLSSDLKDILTIDSASVF